MKFKSEDRKIAKTNSKNARLLSNHFEKVLKRDTIVDWENGNKTTFKRVIYGIAKSLELEEISQVSEKITRHKAPGINSVSTNALKVLDDENIWVLRSFAMNGV